MRNFEWPLPPGFVYVNDSRDEITEVQKPDNTGFTVGKLHGEWGTYRTAQLSLRQAERWVWEAVWPDGSTLLFIDAPPLENSYTEGAIITKYLLTPVI